ncbi:hypothetical protein [Aeromonas veronii]|uniref:hypothetical protein n=1 Tax=Aeromonas veronii TaxID=654 RepID=UPI0031FDE4BC
MVAIFLQKCALTIKRIMFFYQSHSIALSTFSVVAFTSLCYFIVTSYFKDFGLDFFIFGGVSDLYQVALYKGLVIELILLSQAFIIIPVTLYVFGKTLGEFEVSLKNKPVKISSRFDLIRRKLLGDSSVFNEMWPLLIASIVLVGLFSYVAFLSTLSKYNAEDVKNGFSARYSIETNKSLMSCLSVVGATSSYILIWDDQTKMPSALPKSEIKTINLVVPPPPSNRAPSPNGDYKKKVEHQRRLQNEWSAKLEDECHQYVKWREW